MTSEQRTVDRAMIAEHDRAVLNWLGRKWRHEIRVERRRALMSYNRERDLVPFFPQRAIGRYFNGFERDEPPARTIPRIKAAIKRIRRDPACQVWGGLNLRALWAALAAEIVMEGGRVRDLPEFDEARPEPGPELQAAYARERSRARARAYFVGEDRDVDIDRPWEGTEFVPGALAG